MKCSMKMVQIQYINKIGGNIHLELKFFVLLGACLLRFRLLGLFPFAESVGGCAGGGCLAGILRTNGLLVAGLDL